MVLATHCLILVAAFAALGVCIGLRGAHAFFELLGAHGRVLALADDYTRIWFIGFIFFATSMVGANLLRSFGNAAMPGIVMVVGSLIQVLLGPFLIFGWGGFPKLGIEGAAWSFVIARSISFVLCMYWIAVRQQMLVAHLRGWADSVRRILHVGLPATASNLVAPLSTAIITRLLAGYGHGVVAGFAIASRFEAVIFMVAVAVAASVGPFVGQNWGAQLFDRVRSALRLCNGFCVSWGVASLLLMALSARWLVSLVNADPAVVETATTYLLIIPFSLGFMGLMGVASACFNALGKPAPPLVLSLLRLVVVLIPLALVGRALAGYVGVFAAIAIANVSVGVLALAWNNHTVRVDSDAIRNPVPTTA